MSEIKLGHPHREVATGEIVTPLYVAIFPGTFLGATWAGDVSIAERRGTDDDAVVYRRLRDDALFARPVSEWLASVDGRARYEGIDLAAIEKERDKIKKIAADCQRAEFAMGEEVKALTRRISEVEGERDAASARVRSMELSEDAMAFDFDTLRVERDAAREALSAERDAHAETRRMLEQALVQLAGCLTAAEGSTKDPAVQGDYGWSLAYQRTLDLHLALEAERAVRRSAPWSVCKLAFELKGVITNDDDVWAASDRDEFALPAGWSLVETDGSGASAVRVVFEVEGVPNTQDGEVVRRQLCALEKAIEARRRIADRKKGG